MFAARSREKKVGHVSRANAGLPKRKAYNNNSNIGMDMLMVQMQLQGTFLSSSRLSLTEQILGVLLDPSFCCAVVRCVFTVLQQLMDSIEYKIARKFGLLSSKISDR